MAAKTRKISTLIEKQLPGFISSEYQNFSKFVEKYYEQLESAGQPIDIISNITKYRDIDFYEENLLKQYTTLLNNISENNTTIVVDDASSFPKENGYIRINDEICFYKTRTDTEFLEVSRGVSGNTTLGDLYSETTFVTSQSATHTSGSSVYNVSNLFLYAFIKSFESQYLGAFPEKYLKGQVDKRTLIKNINKFYRTKGTDKSIKFLFNSIISRDVGDIPEVYNPKDFTIKASNSDWVSTYSLKVRVLSGDPFSLVGERLVQNLDETRPKMLYASAIVDNVIYRTSTPDGDVYEIILDPATINGTFEVASKTKLKKSVLSNATEGDKINVGSTMGWKSFGKLVIGNEVIKYNSKNVSQFVIEQRGTTSLPHSVGSDVYSFSTVTGNNVTLLTLGVLYNLKPSVVAPYSENKDPIQISDPGFETRDPIIFDRIKNNVRWIFNEANQAPTILTNIPLQNALSQELANVAAIYEDDQYYYICSSGYPSHDILTAEINVNLVGQNILRLIRKAPITTTEVYKTGTRDVGIFVDGTLALNHKDFSFVNYGKLESINVLTQGRGYKRPPFVLLNDKPNKAQAVLSGEVLESIKINTTETFKFVPSVTITAGRNAKVEAVVTGGRITSLVIRNPGEYYSSPPVIRITDLSGKGKFADYNAIVSPKGQLVDFIKIDEGKFYTQENVIVDVIEDAKGFEATATAEVQKWYFDRLEKNKNSIDNSNGYILQTYESLQKQDQQYVYGRIANPIQLRISLQDNLNTALEEFATKVHSPILGFAYDGVPIYGPYGHENPIDSSSPIVKLSSGYRLKSNRVDGPSTNRYPLGTFVEDYVWVPSVNSGKTELDENNGRFCVTPDYPNGVYAYFLTIDENNNPAFPYILGKNYYSLPIDSNYNSNISQSDLPSNVKRLRTFDIEENGSDAIAYIDSISSGGISGADIQYSHNNFQVGSAVYINNSNTNGKDAAASISSVIGKNVVSLECKEKKSVQLLTSQTSYYFAGDTITQPSTGATGTLIGDVINDNIVILRDVNGTFEKNEEIEATTNVISLILDKNSSFTANKIVSLSNGIDSPVATGLILETINNQNNLKIKVLTGEFLIDDDLFLKSSDLNDTVGSKIITLNSLSIGILPFVVNEDIAIAETDENHNLRVGDKVIIDINPDDSLTQTNYYVRKRYYQKTILREPKTVKQINDSGLGRSDLLNSGVDYLVGVYSNVELIFQDTSLSRNNIGRIGDSGNARATITVSGNTGSNYGGVVQILITDKGNGYRKGDILTVDDDSLNRLISSVSTQRLTLVVDHVGFAKENTILKLNSITGISNNDMLQLGEEVVEVISVNEIEETVSVIRGKNQTRIVDHFNNKEVISINSKYRFTEGQRIKGSGVNDPYVYSYDENTQELVLIYDYNTTSPNELLRSNTFYDGSTPEKLVSTSSVNTPEYRLEFSTDNINFKSNPVVQIQKYYKYKFDVSHFSMFDTYLDFSTSLNYNIFTEEKFVSSVPPGNPGSFLTIKLGFGPNISTNEFQQKKPINFTNYFYFIKVSDVNTQNSFLQVVDDPLGGEKEIIYSTDKKFVYKISGVPEYDGTGQINYVTTSKFAIGKINSIFIENFGSDYYRVPTIHGVNVAKDYEASVNVIYDSVEQKIKSVSIVDGGKYYSKPKALVVDGDGKEAEFNVISENGVIKNVQVIKEGKNYSYPPTIKIIESDLKLYFNSKDIGVPQTVNIVHNGYNFHSDKTLYPAFKSPTVLLLENFNGTGFAIGEKVVQYDNNSLIFSGVVAKNGYRSGSNILRLEKTIGVIDKSLQLKGTVKNTTAFVKTILFTEYLPNIKAFFDNQGKFSSDKGKIGVSSQRLTDSFFYQDYSYVVKSKTPISIWRDLIKETVHPAGFKLFGEVSIEATGNTSMPSNIEENKTETINFINLAPKNISVIGTRRYVTESFVNLNSLKVERGVGSISVDTFNNSETIAGDFILSTQFNGRLDSYDGQPIGETVFTMIDKKSGLPLLPYNEQQLIITIDGVLQEPGKAYTVNNTQITFAYPPFGESTYEGQEVSGQKFYGKYFKFKKDQLNSRYLRKLKSLEDQFDGTSKTFDLYYENGNIVKTDKNENLIVTLNSVVQKAKYLIQEESNQYYAPEKNSYYILRSEDENITDKIVFSDPPIKHNDVLETEIPQLSGEEKSFAFTIGSYIRLKINDELIPFTKTGPFLILDEIEDTVLKIDNSKYALVFIDGVLQIEGESYNINGPTITFTKPLNYYVSESGEVIYSNVNIILLYGRDIEQSLIAYDFERDTFYNKLTLQIIGESSFDQFNGWYKDSLSGEIWIYQEDNNVLGKLRNYTKSSSDTWSLIMASQNAKYNPSKSLKASRYPQLNHSTDLTIEGAYQVISSYNKDGDDERILSRQNNKYFYESELADKAWYEQTRSYANLHPGDLIKIDGEEDYREIFHIAPQVKTKDYRQKSFVSNSIYGRVSASNYNKIVRGEGLAVTAKISGGKVVELIWNKRDLQLYLENNLLVQPSPYQYYTAPILHFVPNDSTGGGAKAEVIVYDGQVVDVVLLDGGSEYKTPPSVVVARKYNVIRNPNRKFDSFTNISFTSRIATPIVVGSSRIILPIGGGPETISLGKTAENTFYRQITAIIQLIRVVGIENKKIPTEILLIPPTSVPDFDSLISSNRQIINIIDRLFDKISNVSLLSDNRQVTLEISHVVNNAIITTPEYSINDIGAFLDIALSETDTIVYIADTRRFPDSSRLLIGKEIVTYDGKLPDRFLNVVRGAFGTTATTHEAGDYLRHLPELISIVPVGPETTIITEVSITKVHHTQSSVLQVITSSSTVALSEETTTKVTTQQQIDVDNSDFEVNKFITIIPPTSYKNIEELEFSDTFITSICNSQPVDVFISDERNILMIAQLQINIDNSDFVVLAETSRVPPPSLGNFNDPDKPFRIIGQVTQIVSTSSNVLIDYEREIEVTLHNQININNSDFVVNKQITLIPPPSLLNVEIHEAQTFFTSISTIIEVPTQEIISTVNAGVTDWETLEVTKQYRMGVIDYPDSIIEQEFGNSYTSGNAGFGLRQFESNSFVDGGLLSGNITIEELTIAYPDLTIEDFELRSNSSITLTGRIFNLTQVTIINPVVKAIGTDLTTSDIVEVYQDLDLNRDVLTDFPDQGYIFQGSSTEYSVIEYTGKTTNSFTGCTLISGSSIIDPDNDIIPYTI